VLLFSLFLLRLTFRKLGVGHLIAPEYPGVVWFENGDKASIYQLMPNNLFALLAVDYLLL
jgi:hypothetical protein